MPQESPSPASVGPDASAARALVALCGGVLPVWARHLAASRAQSELAVTEMLKAFSDIGPHINMAERQSQQIAEALSQADGGITGLATACERVLAPLLKDSQLPPSGAAAVGQVLDMVRQAVNALEQIAKPFTHETQMVAEQVERMYIGFQYQDRISQMMALLEGDIARLQDALRSPGAEDPMQLAAWLARLESQYAMAEQHNNHTAQAPDAQAAGDSTETTFF